MPSFTVIMGGDMDVQFSFSARDEADLLRVVRDHYYVRAKFVEPVQLSREPHGTLLNVFVLVAKAAPAVPTAVSRETLRAAREAQRAAREAGDTI